MHFWKSRQKIQPKVSFSSTQGLKLSNKIGSLRLKQNAPITVLWSRRMPFSQPCQNLSIGGRKLLVHLLKTIMRLTRYSKKISSKCSSGCAGGSFLQQAELFFRIHFLWRKIQKQSWFLLEKIFSSEYSYEHAECNFDKLAKKRTRIQEYSAQTLKLFIQTTSFLKKNFSWENVSCHLDCMFVNPAEKKIHQKSEKLLAPKKLGE